MKVKILCLFFLFFLAFESGLFAQFNDSTRVREQYQRYQPLRMGINTGVGVGSMRGFDGSRIGFFNSFLEARGTYALSPRTGLIMGLGYSRNNFNFPTTGDMPGSNQFTTDNYHFTGGAYYHLNDRLTVSGLAQYSVPFRNNFGSQGISPMWNTKSFEMNAQYKISENVTIGAGIRYSQGQFGNGLGNTFHSPFMNPYGNQFGNQFMWP